MGTEGGYLRFILIRCFVLRFVFCIHSCIPTVQHEFLIPRHEGREGQWGGGGNAGLWRGLTCPASHRSPGTAQRRCGHLDDGESWEQRGTAQSAPMCKTGRGALLCTPEQALQMRVPRERDAHVGLGACRTALSVRRDMTPKSASKRASRTGQSAQTSFPGTAHLPQGTAIMGAQIWQAR